MSLKSSIQSFLRKLIDRYVRTMIDYEVLVPQFLYTKQFLVFFFGLA